MPRGVKKIRRYAEGTSVPIDRSRSELEKILEQHGATSIGILRNQDQAMVAFQLDGFNIVKHVKVPKEKNGEAEHRRRWRALVLIIKAKLEIIAGGESTPEREFMADICLPNGNSVGDEFIPRLRKALADGKMPTLALPASTKE